MINRKITRKTLQRFAVCLVSGLSLCAIAPGQAVAPATRPAVKGINHYNVTNFGAIGDGQAIDSAAINKAIEAAADAGGGTVFVPAGTYLSYSIRLKSNITLYLDQGATILAANAPAEAGAPGYDPAEPNQWEGLQDFGHSHWHNSLIWGENLTNIAILGPGMVDGRGLGGGMGGGTAGAGGRGGGAATTVPSIGFAAGNTFGGGGGGGGRRGGGAGGAAGAPGAGGAASQPAAAGGQRGGRGGGRGGGGEGRAGSADKAIALKNCKSVTFRDFTMHRCGHFAILATGVDNFTLDNMTFDTNRDAIDIDGCRNVRLSNLTVNSPNDDGIVLKSSFALGEMRPCENVTITNCLVSGFEVGSVLDATYKTVERRIPDGAGPTGRIKFGTESNAGFKNITISNIVFDHCRGLALETVDGALIEDVSISNITMRNTSNSPIYLRLGARMRAPDGTPIGSLKRVNISNIVAYNADPRFASLIMGLPGHDIEDVKLSNIRIYYIGGGTKEHAAREVPEDETGYPEPQRHGIIPAYGFFIRHAKGIQMDNVEVSYSEPEARPAFMFDDVKGIELNNVKAQAPTEGPSFVLKKLEKFSTYRVKGLADGVKEKVESGTE